MPITEALTDPSVPLGQGDILKGAALFTTEKTWEAGGGAAMREAHALCLLLSRPCVSLREERLVVSAIEKYKSSPPSDYKTYDECRDFFVELRDGLTTPDQFYLGQINGYDGCYCARLDQLHTILVPTKTAPRTDFITRYRIARLHKDFVHDLHLRLFRAFASLGFDDHRWYPTEDLRSFIMYADRDIAKLNQEITDLNAKIQLGQTQGSMTREAKAGLEKQLGKLQTKIGRIEQDVLSYRQALAERPPAESQSRINL